MREIKFRAQRYGRTWVYGYLVKNAADMVFIVSADDVPEEFREVRVTPETVGQYTGLTDADGREIYEGDIIEALGERADVVFDVATGCFAAYPPSGPCELYRVSDDSRVIGNVHDNPDLLTNGKE